MEDCIFCRMFSGEIEFRKVYEDSNVLGVLDIQPRFGRGQCLVIHRRHVPQFYELDDEETAELFRGVGAVARKLSKVFDSPLISLFARGISVPIHAHIVVFPSTGEGPLEKVMSGFAALEQMRGITPDQLDDMAKSVREA